MSRYRVVKPVPYEPVRRVRVSRAQLAAWLSLVLLACAYVYVVGRCAKRGAVAVVTLTGPRCVSRELLR